VHCATACYYLRHGGVMRLVLFVCLSFCLSFCVPDYSKNNQPISLKFGVTMGLPIGRTD